MKILIVDDNVSKAGKLVALFVDAGMPRPDIEVVVSAMSARDRLRVERYELVVLDLLLPLREEDQPALQSALDLITEVCERDVYYKPRRIVGFTAYPEAELKAVSAFKERLWTIVRFDATTSAWETEFRNVAEYLLRIEREPTRNKYATDLCVVTALQIELDAVYSLPWNWSESEPLDDMTFVRRGTFQSHGTTRSVVAACALRMGSVAAALLTSKLIGRFFPRFVAMPGICAGIKDKVRVGDTVLLDPVWEWPSGKLCDGDGGTYLQPSPHQIALSEFLLARAEQLRRDDQVWLKIAKTWNGERPEHAPRLLVGPGASGSAVVADTATVDSIKQQHRKLMAVEMEAYGVYAAASSSASAKPTALAFKTVCDFADEEKADKWQTYACHMSAQSLAAFFERYMGEIHELAGT